MATHHYIPQFILKRFQRSERDVLRVVDKATGHVVYPNVRDFGVENLHRLSEKSIKEYFGGESPDIERSLSCLESEFAPAVDFVVTEGSLAGLAEYQRLCLIALAALQFMRTPGRVYNSERDLHAGIPELGEFSVAPTLKPLGTHTNPGPWRDVRLTFMIPESLEVTRVLQRAHLALLFCPEGRFVIGDNPAVVLPGPVPSYHLGYSICAPGSQAFLPLSPNYALYLFTPPGAVSGTVGQTVERAGQLFPMAVDYLNHHQLLNAVKYVIAPDAVDLQNLRAFTPTMRFSFQSIFR